MIKNGLNPSAAQKKTLPISCRNLNDRATSAQSSSIARGLTLQVLGTTDDVAR